MSITAMPSSRQTNTGLFGPKFARSGEDGVEHRLCKTTRKRVLLAYMEAAQQRAATLERHF